jgi:hypothetical protein
VTRRPIHKKEPARQRLIATTVPRLMKNGDIIGIMWRSRVLLTRAQSTEVVLL